MPDEQCSICDKTFSNRSNLKRHKQNVHKIELEEQPSRPNELHLQFESMNDFLQWKSKIEEETLSFYSKVTHVKSHNEIYYYYECSRSGYYKPRGRGERCLKSQKSAKIGKKCPARINLKITQSSLTAKFYNVHEGHESDLEHLRLPSSFRATIAECVEVQPEKTCTPLSIWFLLRIQDSLQILALTVLFISIFQTNVFQAGYLELLYEKFRWCIVVALVYLALTIALQTWALTVRWNEPLRYNWPAFMGLVYTLQRASSCLHYYFYKKSVISLTDPRFYDDNWIGQRLHEFK